MSRGKKVYSQYEKELTAAIAHLTKLRAELQAAIDADADAYKGVVAAYKQAKETGNAASAIDESLKRATQVPLAVAERAREVHTITTALESITSPSMKSDLITSVALAEAAIRGALANVEINLESVKDSAFITEARRRSRVLTGQ
jgi:formiminotetrahydrofolate cyclodeaminase